MASLEVGLRGSGPLRGLVRKDDCVNVLADTGATADQEFLQGLETRVPEPSDADAKPKKHPVEESICCPAPLLSHLLRLVTLGVWWRNSCLTTIRFSGCFLSEDRIVMVDFDKLYRTHLFIHLFLHGSAAGV